MGEHRQPAAYGWRDALAIGGMAAAYAAIIYGAVRNFSVDGIVSLVYPTPGISIALLLLAGRRWWPGVLLGETAGTFATGVDLATSAVLGVVSTLEAVLASALLAALPRFDRRLVTFGDLVLLLAVAAPVSGLAALAGSGVLAYTGTPGPAQAFWDSVLVWWRGDFTGILMLTPFVLVWSRWPAGLLRGPRVVEAVACFGLAFGVGAVIYVGIGPAWLRGAEVDYVPFLFVAWAALRFGRHGVLALLLMVALQALVGALDGSGVYARDLAEGRLLNFWLFMCVLAGVGMSLAFAVHAREAAFASLGSGEARLRFLLDETPVVVYTARADGDFGGTWISNGAERLTGWPARRFVDEPRFWAEHVHPDDAAAVQAGLAALAVRGRIDSEYRFRCADGSWRWMRDEAMLVRGADGRPQEIVGCWIDITPRRQADERIRAALAEKEVLLKEIYHRVKNNLQVVSSLLNLQSRRAADGVANALLQQSANRVSSMAFVHEQLYRSGDLASIAFADYAVQLVTHLRDTQGEVAQRVPVRLEIPDVRLRIEAAIPLGLIVNELVSNAYKHAFRDGRVGQITVALRPHPAGGLELTVADDGLGLPPGFSLEAPESLGMQLVVSLAAQLGAELSHATARPHGTVFALRFSTDGAAGPAGAPDQTNEQRRETA